MTQHNLSGWSIFNSHWWQERERPTKNIGNKVQLEEQASFTCPFIGSCSFPRPNGDRDKGLHLFHCRLGGRWFMSDQGDHCLLGFTMICHTGSSNLIFSVLNLCLPLANAGHSGTWTRTLNISQSSMLIFCVPTCMFLKRLHYTDGCTKIMSVCSVMVRSHCRAFQEAMAEKEVSFRDNIAYGKFDN